MSRQADKWKVETGPRAEPFEQDWNALVTASNATPFQSYDLMRIFYRHLAEHRQEKGIIALVRHGDGRPAAVFPMLLSRQHGLTWLRTDARPIDYCAPIFDGSLTQPQVRAIIRAVMKAVPEASLLYCNKMPAHFLGKPNPIALFPETGRLRLSAWTLRLEGRSREEVLGAQNPKLRSNLRRCAKRLSTKHERVFKIAFGAEISEADFSDFLKLRSESFDEKGRNDILDDPDWIGFYRTLAGNRSETCLPWMARLEADGELIAVLFGFTNGQRAVAIMPASKSGDWKTYSPGLQLFEESILHFHGLNTRYFDLSIGDMPYKKRLGCDEMALHDALFARGPAGHLYRAIWRLKVKIRDRMKKISEA